MRHFVRLSEVSVRDLLVLTVMVLAVGTVSNIVQAEQSEKQSPGKQARQKNKAKKSAPFEWVNPLPKWLEASGLKHDQFRSPSMKVDVGYCIYLPAEYSTQSHSKKRYPVVYYLHGGRPGSEIKSVRLASLIHEQIESKKVSPMIYVFVNGGPVSHYNMPDKEGAQGEDVFVKELIPHIDAEYRTIAKREGRGLEGFSQGGRGTARIMFKHPHLFSSCSPGGGGYATEKKISESKGWENSSLKFHEGDNTWDLAKRYAQKKSPEIRILVHVGTKGFNYENNLEYMKHLDSLKIPYERLIVPKAPHSAMEIYKKSGFLIMKFHAENFMRTGAIE